MSNVKSFRFTEFEEKLLSDCTLEGTTSHDTIVNALLYYLDNVINPLGYDLTVNFDQMPDGVNHPLVGKFVEQVSDSTDFEFKMYGDGDTVCFNLKDNS